MFCYVRRINDGNGGKIGGGRTVVPENLPGVND